MKEVRREVVRNCPCCRGSIILRSFDDWNGIAYHQCKDCKSIFQNPRIIFEYEENYWGEIIDPDGNKRELKLERDFKVKNWYGDTVSYVNKLPPGKILDVGAGLGFFLSAINSEWEKYALEVSGYAVQIMEDQYPDISVQKSLLEDTDFGENQFDVIMFYHVIEHLENPNKILKILHKLLKHNGVLIVGTPNIGSLAALLFKGNFRLYGPGHLCLFNPKSLKWVLSESGFRVHRTEYPFWKTDYANIKNVSRMFSLNQISPPFYGSLMTVYARKK